MPNVDARELLCFDQVAHVLGAALEGLRDLLDGQVAGVLGGAEGHGEGGGTLSGAGLGGAGALAGLLARFLRCLSASDQAARAVPSW